MRKVVYLVFCLAAVASAAHAQSFQELSSSNPVFYNELYAPYPSDRVSDVHPAPKGYTPVYISHLGRHGSRWHIGKKWYDGILNILSEADSKGELTPVGKQLLTEWSHVADIARDRYGELCEKGREEHTGISERLCRNYPEIFAKQESRTSRIVCRSTVVPRCIFSMITFVEPIRKNFPWIEPEMEATEANRYLKAVTGLNPAYGESHVVAERSRKALMPPADDLMLRLFTPESTVVAAMEDKNKFMFDLYIALSNPAYENGRKIDLIPLAFSEDEIAKIWVACNVRRYFIEGPSAQFGKTIIGAIAPLVTDIVDCADAALQGNDVVGDFRFAHDVTMVASAKFLGIAHAQTETDDINQIAPTWRITEISPMASNIQLIFFRNAKGDVLVKVLFCEREQRLVAAAGKPVDGYYYHWSDLKKFIENQKRYFSETK